MERKHIIAVLIIVVILFLSICQIYFVYNKYQMFFNDYDQQVWENHTADCVFGGSYIFTLALISFGCVYFLKKPMNNFKIRKILGLILIISILISITASTILYTMHSKRMLVGYHEWMQHNKGID